MILNGKLRTDDGKYEVAVFPSQELNITQGTNTNYSHRCTKNTDNACIASRRRIYAPCKMKLVSNQSSAGYGVVIYQTVEPVQMADGTVGHFTLSMMHDNNASRWQVGKIYEQGEFFYEEGNADPSGLTTGIHVHYEVAKGHTTSRVKTCDDGYYHLANPCYLDEIFFRNLTVFRRENAPAGIYRGDHTFNFKEYKGGIVPPKPPSQDGDGMYHAMISKAFPFGL